MLRNKIFRIITVLIITTASGLILSTGCYQDDNETRITIHLDRYDLAENEVIRDKRFIDRILEFFSTPAEAGAFWSNVKTNLTLSITTSANEKLEFTLPANATTYTVIVPSGNNTNFTVTSKWDSIYNGIQKNMGGEAIVNLLPGEQDLTIQVKPMTYIVGVTVPGAGPGLNIQWLISGMHASVSTYKIYRSTDPDGPYSILTTSAAGFFNDISISTGVRYYYRISTVGTLGESIPSDVVSGIR